MVLRYYQKQSIENIKDFFSTGGLHVILQAATGSGKTVIFSDIAKRTAEKGNKVLILTDRAELLQQAGSSINRIGLSVNYIIAGSKKINKNFNCFVAMSQTLRRRIKLNYWTEFLKSIDLLIIDECHKQEFNYIFESMTFAEKHVIGFSATPKRSGKMRQLGLDYEKIIQTISIKELIDKKFLVNDDYYGFGAPSLEDVGFDYMKGDYKESSLFKKFNSPKTYSGAIKAYKQHVKGTKAICFCVNIEHCINTAIEFNKAGINAKFIVSGVSNPKQPNPENKAGFSRYNERKRVFDLMVSNKHLTGLRKDIFNDFKNNKFDVLINAGIATTGYDEPSIETVIVLRATLSTSLWLQMIGRGSRIFEGKTHFNILDFGANAERLGHYTENRNWFLWHEQFEGNGLPPIKNCGINSDGRPITNKEGCKRPILATYKICPFCGFKYPEKKAKEVDLELIIFDLLHKKSIKTKRLKDMTNHELNEYRELKGHKMGWLWRQLWLRGEEKAIREFGKEFNWTSTTVEKAVGFMKRVNN